MRTLHILRSEPDEQLRELVETIDTGDAKPIALYDDVVDYDRLIEEIFRHDRVICWWGASEPGPAGRPGDRGRV